MATFDLKAYARKGVEARLRELDAEREEIFKAFPELREETRGRRGGGSRSTASDAPDAAPRKRRMSAAQKKAVSVRMKKYWAGRREGKKR